MIISASRRTDIPAFYAKWFMNRVGAGYCTVPNPCNMKQVSYVSLQPEAVTALVFWTRNPAPLLPRLRELDERGFGYYFLYTLVNNPKVIDPYSPSIDHAVATFCHLADKIGPERVIWRYDPIVLGNVTSVQYHLDNFGRIAEKIGGCTNRSMISFVEDYRKTGHRMARLKQHGIVVQSVESLTEISIAPLVAGLARIAEQYGIELLSCAEKLNLVPFGVQPGKCIDGDLLARLFKVNVLPGKDRSQRQECRCVASRDIGMYDSCLFGCSYCYATRNFDLSRRNHRSHNPASPSLLGWYDAEQPYSKKTQPGSIAASGKQQRLF